MKKILLAVVIIFSIGLKAQTEVTFYTSKGDFVITLNDSLMPITTGNFINLVNNKGYDGKTFYRVISNFVIQGGYRTNTPPPIPDEFDSTGALSNRRWTIAMANSGPNTGSSEIFINLKDNLFLDYNKPPLTSAHPVFGSVSSGWTTVSDIGLVATDPNDQPLIPVVMDSLRVTSSPLSLIGFGDEPVAASIYPNPVTATSVLEVQSSTYTAAKIEVLDVSGKLLFSKEVKLSQGKNTLTLSKTGLVPAKEGLYFLRIQTDRSILTFKIQYHPN